MLDFDHVRDAPAHACRVRSCDIASRLRTLSSVAPELASWLILDNTVLNCSPENTQKTVNILCYKSKHKFLIEICFSIKLRKTNLSFEGPASPL